MAGPVSDSAILDALRPIVDPDFGKSIVDLGFVKNVQIDGSDVSFAIELTTPAWSRPSSRRPRTNALSRSTVSRTSR
jgi:ATP-binding protein involved in chromosome partitioning